VDNSKATNPHATLAAVGSLDGVVLIAGGDAKGVDLSPIASLADRLAGVVAIGASAAEVVSLFEGRVPTRKAGSIEEAVRTAFELAPARGTVLLAPACASWDMFRDYGERGDRFAEAARGIAREVGP
jgi:UDP-N-acetylmuramoylalanine--D-glutamate ligase